MSGAKVRNSEEYYINIYVFMDVEENFRGCSAAKAWMLMYCQALLIPGNALNSYIFYLPSQKINTMSPRAIFISGFDFFFYSKEEERKHIHVEKGEKSAKVWLEPTIEVATNYGFTSKEIRFIIQTIQENEQLINEKWNYHFGREQG